MHSLLQRVRDLAVQASNGTSDQAAREAAQSEVDQALAEIDRIAQATVYGSKSLLDGGSAGVSTFTFHVGAGTQAFNQVAVAVSAMTTAALTINTVDVVGNSLTAIQAVDDAIKAVSAQRSSLGAFQNRLEHTVSNLGVAVENLSASESRIRDTDMAEEMVQFTRSQILAQAGTAMLAQANQLPQSVLQLLR